jgi:hypothetical protein
MPSMCPVWDMDVRTMMSTMIGLVPADAVMPVGRVAAACLATYRTKMARVHRLPSSACYVQPSNLRCNLRSLDGSRANFEDRPSHSNLPARDRSVCAVDPEENDFPARTDAPEMMPNGMPRRPQNGRCRRMALGAVFLPLHGRTNCRDTWNVRN